MLTRDVRTGTCLLSVATIHVSIRFKSVFFYEEKSFSFVVAGDG